MSLHTSTSPIGNSADRGLRDLTRHTKDFNADDDDSNGNDSNTDMNNKKILILIFISLSIPLMTCCGPHFFKPFEGRRLRFLIQDAASTPRASALWEESNHGGRMCGA